AEHPLYRLSWYCSGCRWALALGCCRQLLRAGMQVGQGARRHLLWNRQGEDEGCACPRPALRPDTPVMRMDDGGTYGKSQACARRRSLACPRQLYVPNPIEFREDRLQCMWRDSNPLIRDAPLQVLMLPTWRKDACQNGDGAALRRVLERVLNQIRQHLLDLRVIEQHGRYIVWHIHHNIIPLRPADEV